jgi:hypothetical protein
MSRATFVWGCTAAVSLALFAACDGEDPKPITPIATVDSGAPPATQCGSFATVHEQILNAPTESAPIRKTVVLPAP